MFSYIFKTSLEIFGGFVTIGGEVFSDGANESASREFELNAVSNDGNDGRFHVNSVNVQVKYNHSSHRLLDVQFSLVFVGVY